jgi:hypothetical protein
LCGNFSFLVANKEEASLARLAFYAANVRLNGLDFSDNRFDDSSKFILAQQIFVLHGLDGYQRITEDRPLTLEIRALSKVENTRSRTTTPCTFPGSAAAFDNMKSEISEKWKIHVHRESPEYVNQRSAPK